MRLRRIRPRDDKHMAKNPAQLNQKQLDVLQWIRDGCPQGIYSEGNEHKIIAWALERRGLITITGARRTWAAKITDAGKQWQAAPPAPVLPDHSAADRLVSQVLAAGGRLILPQDRDVEAAHERLVRMSMKSPSRPRGKKLQIVSTERWGDGPKAVVLADHLDDLVQPRPVPVPERIGRYHPAVKAFVTDTEWQYVTADHVARAARILQAIATEAPKRGIDVIAPGTTISGLSAYQAREVRRGHLALRTPTGLYSIQVREVAGKGGQKVAPRRWDERKTKPAWIEKRGWEFISTGRLELVVHGADSSYNGDHYRDAKSITVEERLPDLFRSFEIYKLGADRRQQEREREQADRHARWEAAMVSAKEQYFTRARWEHFKQRSRDWQEIDRHRQFLQTARMCLQHYDGDDRDAIVCQLDEAARTIVALDPIGALARLVPVIPEPKPEDLTPFLHGWSPHGPEKHRL